MYVTVDGRELSDVLGIVGKAVPGRTTRPVLQNVILDATGDDLRIAGTDLEVAVRQRVIEAEVTDPGRVLVPADRLQAIARELQTERLELEARDGSMEIRAPGARFLVHAGEVSAYPDLPFPSDDPDLEIGVDPEVLDHMIRRTTFATAAEQARFALNGVLVRLREGVLRFVATDGKRLALLDRTIEDVPDDATLEVVAPPRALEIVAQVEQATDEPVRLGLVGSHLVLRTADAEVACRLVEGQFPPYEEVIPEALPRTAEVAVGPLTDAVRQAGLLATKESRAVRFQFRENRLVLTARVADVGETEVEMALKYEDGPIDIGFNPSFFGEYLRRVDATTLRLTFGEADGPAVLREEAPDGRNAEGSGRRRDLYLVMPIDLHDEAPETGEEAAERPSEAGSAKAPAT